MARVLLHGAGMLTHRRSLLLVLAPVLALAPACDKEGPNDGGSAGDSVAESEGTDSDSASGTDSDSAGGTDSEGGTDSAGGSTTSVDPPAPRPSAAEPCDWEAPQGQACTTEGGVEGESFCIIVDGAEFQTPCVAEPACVPGDGFDYGCMGEICVWDGEALGWYSWSEPDCNTPLVVNLDGSPLTFEAASAASFDISAVGECLSTDWPSLPWLALDRDGDGVISDGRELFGTGSRLAGGERARDGFAALAEFDADHDGSITAADPIFAELVLWSDVDGDRRGELRELLPVSSIQLVAIHLGAQSRSECDGRGNCGGLRSSFEFVGAGGSIERGEIVDVVLSCQ